MHIVSPVHAMSAAPPIEPSPPSSAATFLAGWRAAWTSVFSLVLIGAYVGIGALAHDYGFSLAWVAISTVLVWAGPAQVIHVVSVLIETQLVAAQDRRAGSRVGQLRALA